MDFYEIPTNPFKVIIAGGRDFNDYDKLYERCRHYLSSYFHTSKLVCQPVLVISGTAKGADQLGERFAMNTSCLLKSMPAQWKEFGKSAGYKRNVQMAENADALIAFWDGKSRGTKHMIDIAKQKKLLVRVVRY